MCERSTARCAYSSPRRSSFKLWIGGGGEVVPLLLEVVSLTWRSLTSVTSGMLSRNAASLTRFLWEGPYCQEMRATKENGRA